MSWPTPQEYNEAIQNPHLNFGDEELKSGAVELNKLGLPQPSTGAFASVYKMHCEDRDVAVRCFLQSNSDQSARYKALAQRLSELGSDLFVNFQYVDHGMLVGKAWQPIVKMEWVNGKTLDEFVRANVADTAAMRHALKLFESAYWKLNQVGIAHGDLQHGNIIIDGDSLRLIDYDGTYLDSIAALGTGELGHPNYQHPGRHKALFNPQIDNFSAWVIQQSLQVLIEEPDLLRKLRGCEECLLWRHIDYAQPARSGAFHLMEQSENESVREIGRTMRSLCTLPPDSIPALGVRDKLPAPIALDTTHINQIVTVFDDDQIHVAEEDIEEPTQPPGDWPSLRQFVQAVRNGHSSFADEELKSAKPIRDGASVFKILGRQSLIFPLQSSNRKVAVKIFLNDDPERRDHYLQAEAYRKKRLPWNLQKNFLQFEYMSDGIKVGDKWYPIVKMNWLENAMPIPEYIETTKYNKWVAFALLEEWRSLLEKLEKAGIAHGSLDPANIVMHEGQLKLVDYDTLFVPSMEGKKYAPISVPNPDVSHPQQPNHLYKESDHFTAWLIDTALLAWALDPQLYNILDNHRLLFTASDLQDPANSRLFALLHHNYHDELSARAALLFRFLHMPPRAIPPLQTHALPLLPATTAKAYRQRQSQLAWQASAIVGGFFGVMALTMLPHGSIIALVPTAAIAWTVHNIVRQNKKFARKK